MRARKPFTLIKRQRKSTQVWFYRTYAPDGRRVEYSTGLEAGRGKASKTAAEAAVLELYKAGKLIPTRNADERITFESFAKEFFDKKSAFARRRATTGRPYSGNYLAASASALKNHIMPAFKRRRLVDIKRRDVEAFAVSLLEAKSKEGEKTTPRHSSKSVRNIMQSLGVVLGEAARQELIPSNPCEGALLPSAAPRVKKEALRPAELQALFAPEVFISAWKSDEIIRTAVLVAASTGARLGEILALQCGDVFEDHLVIQRSWSVIDGEKSTKSGRARVVPLTLAAHEALEALKKMRGKGLLFTYNGKKPISARHLQDRFSEALAAVKITQEEQARRGLTFHALRVTFNSLVRAAGVSDSKIQAAIGHTSTAMTDRYTSYALEDLRELAAAAEGMFAKEAE